MGRLALVYNPGSGRRRERSAAVSRMVAALARRGISAEAHATEAPGDATRLVREALAAGAEAIVIHGGDGSVNEALQPLVGGDTPLAVWPGGTANVLARELGLPADIERVAALIASARVRRVSVGRAGNRYFLLMAGVGLDAALVRAVNPLLKRAIGQGAYWAAGVRHVARWRPQRFVVEVEGREYGAMQAVIANAPRYGGGLRVTPRARLDSDVLDLCLFDWRGRLAFLHHLAAGAAGAHLGLRGVTYLQAARARVRGDDATWVQVDGEPLGPLPMTFDCVPAALSLMVPG